MEKHGLKHGWGCSTAVRAPATQFENLMAVGSIPAGCWASFILLSFLTLLQKEISFINFHFKVHLYLRCETDYSFTWGSTVSNKQNNIVFASLGWVIRKTFHFPSLVLSSESLFSSKMTLTLI